MKKEESVIGRNLKKGAQDGDKQSNGLHTLKLAYQAKKERQLADVAKRLEASQCRTYEEQIALLDERLGVGVGAKKERAQIGLQILYRKLSDLFPGRVCKDEVAAEQLKKGIQGHIRDLWDAQMESLGYRIMRQLGLEERPVAEQITGIPGKLTATEVLFDKDGYPCGGGPMA